MLQVKCDQNEGYRYSQCSTTANVGDTAGWFEIEITEPSSGCLGPVTIQIHKLTDGEEILPEAKHACNFNHARTIIEKLIGALPWAAPEAVEMPPEPVPTKPMGHEEPL